MININNNKKNAYSSRNNAFVLKSKAFPNEMKTGASLIHSKRMQNVTFS